MHEITPPVVYQQFVIYKFQCDLCGASSVRVGYYTLRHLYQCMVEHTKQSSSIGEHLIFDI